MIETTYFWWNIVALALGTILIRGSIIAVSSKIVISDRTKKIFSFIPAAILPAFIAPAVFFHKGHVGIVFGKERMIILVAATLVCFISRSTLATIGFGLVSLYLVTQVF